MRHSEFWQLMTSEFGPGYAASVAQDHVVAVLGGRTAQQALDAGADPRDVWSALCEEMGVPTERRWGPQPPLPRNGRGERRGS